MPPLAFTAWRLTSARSLGELGPVYEFVLELWKVGAGGAGEGRHASNAFADAFSNCRMEKIRWSSSGSTCFAASMRAMAVRTRAASSPCCRGERFPRIGECRLHLVGVGGPDSLKAQVLQQMEGLLRDEDQAAGRLATPLSP